MTYSGVMVSWLESLSNDDADVEEMSFMRALSSCLASAAVRFALDITQEGREKREERRREAV